MYKYYYVILMSLPKIIIIIMTILIYIYFFRSKDLQKLHKQLKKISIYYNISKYVLITLIFIRIINEEPKFAFFISH